MARNDLPEKEKIVFSTAYRGRQRQRRMNMIPLHMGEKYKNY
jgi:hypothetical protein